MAKKTARQRKEQSQLRAIQQAAANVNQAVARPDAPVVAPQTQANPRLATIAAEEYDHVRKDLRRILILASSIVVILIALSFVIR